MDKCSEQCYVYQNSTDPLCVRKLLLNNLWRSIVMVYVFCHFCRSKTTPSVGTRAIISWMPLQTVIVYETYKKLCFNSLVWFLACFQLSCKYQYFKAQSILAFQLRIRDLYLWNGQKCPMQFYMLSNMRNLKTSLLLGQMVASDIRLKKKTVLADRAMLCQAIQQLPWLLIWQLSHIKRWKHNGRIFYRVDAKFCYTLS